MKIFKKTKEKTTPFLAIRSLFRNIQDFDVYSVRRKLNLRMLKYIVTPFK